VKRFPAAGPLGNGLMENKLPASERAVSYARVGLTGKNSGPAKSDFEDVPSLKNFIPWGPG